MAGKGDAPRSCWSKEFQHNYTNMFGWSKVKQDHLDKVKEELIKLDLPITLSQLLQHPDKDKAYYILKAVFNEIRSSN